MLSVEKITQEKEKQNTVCNSCGKPSGIDHEMKKITFGQKDDEKITVCLCSDCAHLLRELVRMVY